MSDLNFDGLTEAQLRLFAIRCARRVQHLMTDPRSVAVIDVAERHSKGEATDAELSEARAAAWFAARTTVGAGWDAAWAAWDAAWTSTQTSMRAAATALSAARRAVVASAWDATTASAWDAAWEAECAEQQKILEEIRRNTQ